MQEVTKTPILLGGVPGSLLAAMVKLAPVHTASLLAGPYPSTLEWGNGCACLALVTVLTALIPCGQLVPLEGDVPPV